MPPWNLVFLAGFFVFVAIRGVYKERAKGNEAVVRRRDAMEIALLVIMAQGTLLLPLLHLFTSWLAFADYPLPWRLHGAVQ